MTHIIQSELFFFISSIGFIVFGVLATILLLKMIRIANTFQRIIRKAEKDIDSIGDTTKEIIEEIHDSPVFKFLTHSQKKKHTTKK